MVPRNRAACWWLGLEGNRTLPYAGPDLAGWRPAVHLASSTAEWDFVETAVVVLSVVHATRLTVSTRAACRPRVADRRILLVA